MITKEEFKKISSQRFWSKIKFGEPNECWEWQAARSKVNGYGSFFYWGRSRTPHRYSAFLFLGDIKGKHVCHTCDNKICVNPNHLFIGTALDNMRDMIAKGRKFKVSMKGESNPASKLTEENVLDILERLKRGETKTNIARHYKMAINAIFCIKEGINWKYLTKLQKNG